MGTLTENITDLKRLFGKQFIDGPSFAHHPIRQSIERVLMFHEASDYANRDYENSSISLLVKNLKEISSYDKKLFKVFRSALQSSNNHTYFGIRFEVSTAASLVRNTVTFQKTERPDFTLLEDWNGVCIECGSAHLSKSRTGIADLKYKIGSVIRGKSQYDYCNINTALFIDFTNINYHSTLQEILPSVDELKDYVSEQLKPSTKGDALCGRN